MRYRSLDILKAICAFLVICIHAPFPGKVGLWIFTLGRIAVPCFFMTSGFLYGSVAERGGQLRQMKRLLLLTAQALAFYLVFYGLWAVLSGDLGSFSRIFTFKNILIFLLFNDCALASHLWYLGAVLYVLLIVYWADRLGIGRLLYPMIPVLLLSGMALEIYAAHRWDDLTAYILTRNFLFKGLPYFCMGRLISSGLGHGVGGRPLAVGILLLICLNLLEQKLLMVTGVAVIMEHYLSTFFLAVALFLFALSSTGRREGSPLSRLLGEIGRKWSAWIYILHPAFLRLMREGAERLGLESLYRCIAPLAVWGGTLLFLVVWDRARRLLLKKAADRGIMV